MTRRFRAQHAIRGENDPEDVVHMVGVEDGREGGEISRLASHSDVTEV